jgi:hypothetical protein
MKRKKPTVKVGFLKIIRGFFIAIIFFENGV